jgi:serine/threonine-protein kinase RsbW
MKSLPGQQSKEAGSRAEAPVLLDDSFPATAESVSCARWKLDRSLPLNLSAQVRYDVELAFTEACTNALRHGSPYGSANQFHVHCEIQDSRLIMEVRDEGRGFSYEPPPEPPKDPLNGPVGGWGLYLMYKLMDALQVERLPCGCGTLVRMVKKFG